MLVVRKAAKSANEFRVTGPDATGRYCAKVVQVINTAAGREEQLLESRMFNTTGAARRWLNTKL